MARTKSSTTHIKDLQAENESLRKELAALKRSQASPVTPPKQPGAVLKRIGVIFSIIMATALLVSGNLLFWAGNTIVDPERFNAVVSPLIKAPEVQQVVSRNVSERLFERVDVQQLLSENLPDRIAFAAPAIANQVQNATQNAVMRVMQNDSFQQTWNSTIETIHARFIAFVKNYQGDGTIQVADLYNKLVTRLSDTKFSFLSKVSLPQSVGSITIADASWLPVAHNIVNNIDFYRGMAIVLCIGFVALAIWLSRRKRRTAIIIGMTFAIFMVLTLIAVRITVQQIVASFASDNQAAIKVVSDTLLDTLILQTRVLFVVGVLIAAVAWIGSPSKSATIVRSRVQTLFGGNFHTALFGSRENAFTNWLGRHKRIVQWLCVAIAALVVVTTTLNMTTIAVVLVGLIVAMLLIELLAAPQQSTVASSHK